MGHVVIIVIFAHNFWQILCLNDLSNGVSKHFSQNSNHIKHGHLGGHICKPINGYEVGMKRYIGAPLHRGFSCDDTIHDMFFRYHNKMLHLLK